MKYFTKCNSVFNRNAVEVIGEDEVHYFTIEHAKLPKIYGLTIKDVINDVVYKVNYNPLKFKKRFQLVDTNKQPIMAISVGLKYLHKIEYNNKIYSCKGNLWKIRYKLYDWIRDYDWGKHRNPGFQQEIWIQALMQVMLDNKVKILPRGKKGALPFIENDTWAETNEERKEEMQKLLKAVKEVK